MIALLLACSTLDNYKSNPFEYEDCNYTLQDAQTWEEVCYQTRPYFEFGGIYTKVVEDYTTFDLIVSAAPEGAIGMEQIDLGVSAPSHWNLEELLTIEYPNGKVEPATVEDSTIEIDGVECLSANEELIFVLTFDYSNLETSEDDFLDLGFNSVQTWFQVGDPEQTTRFRDQAHDQTSESVGIGF
jgi:hypothetical protein